MLIVHHDIISYIFVFIIVICRRAAENRLSARKNRLSAFPDLFL